MPTVSRTGPFRFFFYSGDGEEPPHVHVEQDASEAKFWLDPVRLERSHGFSRKELGSLRGIIDEHLSDLKERGNEFFNG